MIQHHLRWVYLEIGAESGHMALKDASGLKGAPISLKRCHQRKHMRGGIGIKADQLAREVDPPLVVARVAKRPFQAAGQCPQ